MSEEKKEDRFATIRENFEKYLDVIGIQCFRIILDGQCYASTNKRNARISIGLPKTIVDKNLKTIDDFVLFGVAIPRNLLKK